MARPTKTDDPRRSILTAARALVLETGHHRVSLRAVAERAGFSPASLYGYFDSREELLGTVAAEASLRLGHALGHAVSHARTPSTALLNLGLAYVAFAHANREDFLLLFSGLESTRQSASQPVPADSPYRVVVDAVRRAAGPRASKARVEQVAYVLWAAVHGMAMLQATHLRGFEADFKAADRAGLRALIAGLELNHSM